MPALFFNYDQFDFQIPVSDQFILQDMPGANGEYVKVYLYIYRSFYRGVPNFSTAKAAQSLQILESDVMHALSYWEKKGVLKLHQDGEQLWISFNRETTLPPRGSRPAYEEPAPSEQSKVIRVERKPIYSPEEMDVYSKNPTIKRLFSEAQQLLGQPLSSSDMMILFGFLDYYRLPVEVILYLIQVCLENGNRSFRYMEKVAEDWSDHQIDTLEKAEQYMQRSRVYQPLFKALGMSYHAPSDMEREYVDRWMYQYGFSLELILEAARRTFQKTGRPNFKYMDRILDSWAQENVRTMEDVALSDEAYNQNRFGMGAMGGSSAGYAMNGRNTPQRKGSYFASSGNPYYDYATYQRLAKEIEEEDDEEE